MQRTFKDVADVSGWAQASVVQAARWGLIQGKPDGSFAPQQSANRAEAAQMIYNLLMSLE